MDHPDPFDLQRFVDAQAPVVDRAITELRAGRKRTHWMWFVFPQVVGLGSSRVAQRYAIRSMGEARAYLAHPTLGPNLARCVDAVLLHDPLDPSALVGWPDDLKLRSSMTLFEAVGAARAAEVLERGYGGERDAATVAVLEGVAGARRRTVRQRPRRDVPSKAARDEHERVCAQAATSDGFART